MTTIDVDAYLERIGATRPERPDYAGLCHLTERHMMAVPFETLDFTLREIPSIKDEDVFEKLVTRRRGGGCGELNSGFRMLLEALGYRVTLLGGRVLHNGKESFNGLYNGHAVLRVELDHSYIVDVGFRWCPRKPLRLDARGVQADPHGGYEIVYTPDGDIEMVHDGVTRWRIEMHPRALDDFAATMWFCATFPGVPGAGQLWASIVTEHGRISMFNRVLTEYANGERVSSRVLTDDAEFLKVFEDTYGIKLEKVPDLPVSTEGV
ncbi:arylamine N-acetyltransferase [Actinospica sp. MGRD01-02]|uniref:Arylamine N-acetyltransferase n=1 Tax=Actinospica acidithermotolerans TaxID=2828514 RepID=A0A941EEC7_9ACTN|nr:arylamine N-acetyltransferase [Actinospica acidithermotolerans]MBR7829817.1 arylamine N-acetyltransferase [Actinospica acidithermotolerans]